MSNEILDVEAAKRLLNRVAAGLSLKNIDVYFWQATEADLLNATTLITAFDGALNYNYADFGFLTPGGIHDINPYEENITDILYEFKSLGIIGSYHFVDSPINSAGGLVDLSIGMSDLLNPVTLGLSWTGSMVGADLDSDSESIIFLDEKYPQWTVRKQNFVFMHELAHSMGFAHPHDKSVGLTDSKYNSQKYTIMSYFGHPGFQSDPTDTDVVPTSLMLLDYLALNKNDLLLRSYQSTSSNYWWAGSEKVVHCIYDTGGVDTISARSHQEAVIIDLRDGHFSSYGAGGINGQAPVENLAIAYDTIIENAIGGDNDDVLIGNSVGNNLNGGKGDDFIYGNGVNYKTSDWNFSVAHKKAYAETVDDTVTNIDDADILSGGEGNDYINGGSGDDTLAGDEGFDILYGGMENDNLNGGADADHLYGGDITFAIFDGNDTLDGGTGNDILEGGTGNDTYIFSGEFGHDVIKDSDSIGSIIIDGATLNTLTQTNAGGKVYRDATNTFEAVKIEEGNTTSLIISKISNSNNSVTIKNWNGATNLGITLTDTQPVTNPTSIRLDGTAGNNFLASNHHFTVSINIDGHTSITEHDSNNTKTPEDIHGGGGTDFIEGSYSNDNLFGDAGNDLLLGWEGKDELYGGADNDTLFGNATSFFLKAA